MLALFSIRVSYFDRTHAYKTRIKLTALVRLNSGNSTNP